MRVGERKRLGVFGGTFDPPHIGHLVIADDAREQLGLDGVLLMVANLPWQKVGTREVSTVTDLLDMVNAALADELHLTASTIEIERGGPSYMVDTLDELTAANPDTDWFLLVGSDAAAGLDTWHAYERLTELATIVVFPRPGHEDQRPPAGIDYELLRTPLLEVSSSDLRSRVGSGRSIRHLVPDSVRRLIVERDLYR